MILGRPWPMWAKLAFLAGLLLVFVYNLARSLQQTDGDIVLSVARAVGIVIGMTALFAGVAKGLDWITRKVRGKVA